jgi:hypothetical protein
LSRLVSDSGDSGSLHRPATILLWPEFFVQGRGLVPVDSRLKWLSRCWASDLPDVPGLAVKDDSDVAASMVGECPHCPISVVPVDPDGLQPRQATQFADFLSDGTSLFSCDLVAKTEE